MQGRESDNPSNYDQGSEYPQSQLSSGRAQYRFKSRIESAQIYLR